MLSLLDRLSKSEKFDKNVSLHTLWSGANIIYSTNSKQISEKLIIAENTIIQQQLRLSTLEHQMSDVMDQLATILTGPTIATVSTVTVLLLAQ